MKNVTISPIGAHLLFEVVTRTSTKGAEDIANSVHLIGRLRKLKRPYQERIDKLLAMPANDEFFDKMEALDTEPLVLTVEDAPFEWVKKQTLDVGFPGAWTPQAQGLLKALDEAEVVPEEAKGLPDGHPDA